MDGPEREELAFVQFPAWMRDGACVGRSDVEFFVERGGNDQPARAVCVGCLVRSECLGYALEHNITAGVWGGTSARTRRSARARSLSAAELLAELDDDQTSSIS